MASFVSYNASSRQLTVNVDNSKAGVYEFTLTARDQHSDTGSTDSVFSITVINNEAPMTTEVFRNETVTAYHLYELRFDLSKFSDINGDAIHFNMSSNASWISLDTSNLLFSGTPENANIGVHEITLTAYDDYRGVTNITYTINVTENNEPVRTNVPIPDPVEIQCMHPFSFDFNDYFYDPNGESLEIEDLNTSSLAWMSIDNSTGILSGFHQNQ